MQRGNNRSAIFSTPVDYEVFLDLARTVAGQRQVAVHAYALMTNHYHLLVTPETSDGIPRMMKALNGRYVRYYNRRYQRVGTLWNGRYRGISIGDERYWLTCLRYIEQNPARAGITEDLASYPWSSYRIHATESTAPTWLMTHPIYAGLGTTDAERQLAYRSICANLIDPGEAYGVL